MKAAIYDMDELMIKSISLHKQSWDVLKKYGHSIQEYPLELESGIVGLRIFDITKRYVDYFKLDVSPEELYKERQELFMRIAEEKVEMMPGLIQSLKFFKKSGFRIALASSSPKEFIDLVLAKFKIAKYFEAIISQEDVKKGKPDPEPYLLACRKLGLPPNECVVLEDAQNGVQSAKAAGCRCIAVDSPDNPSQDLKKADVQLDSLAEINDDVIKRLD